VIRETNVLDSYVIKATNGSMLCYDPVYHRADELGQCRAVPFRNSRPAGAVDQRCGRCRNQARCSDPGRRRSRSAANSSKNFCISCRRTRWRTVLGNLTVDMEPITQVHAVVQTGSTGGGDEQGRSSKMVEWVMGNVARTPMISNSEEV